MRPRRLVRVAVALGLVVAVIAAGIVVTRHYSRNVVQVPSRPLVAEAAGRVGVGGEGDHA